MIIDYTPTEVCEYFARISPPNISLLFDVGIGSGAIARRWVEDYNRVCVGFDIRNYGIQYGNKIAVLYEAFNLQRFETSNTTQPYAIWFGCISFITPEQIDYFINDSNCNVIGCSHHHRNITPDTFEYLKSIPGVNYNYIICHNNDPRHVLLLIK